MSKKPLNQRTHSKSISAQRQNMSPEQIRAAKCQKKMARAQARKKFFLDSTPAPLTPEQQLAKLDARLGVNKGAARERKRLKKKMEKV